MKIMICDGNEAQVEAHKQLLTDFGKKYSVLMEIIVYTEVEKLLFDMEEEYATVDLCILEVSYSNVMDGLQVGKRLRKCGYDHEIIYYTEEKSRVREAFDAEALHYLIKKKDPSSKFEEVFLRAKEKSEKREREAIVLSCGVENRSVPLNDILYFEFFKRQIVVHYGNETFEFYSTLDKLENLLKPKEFSRTHKAFLVSLKAISNINGAEITLRDGSVIPLSRTYQKNVVKAYNELEAIVY